MTLETLLAGAREVNGPRHDEERRTFCGVAFTVWRGATTWFAQVDGGGFGVGADRQSVIDLAEAAIEDGDEGPGDEDE